MTGQVLHLSSVAGSPLLDSSGERLGRVEDLIARLDGGAAQPRIGGRELFVPAARVATLEPHAARTATTKLNLGQFERRPGELLLRADILGRSLINVQTAHLATAREVELVCEDGVWRVLGIDTALVARLRRLLPRRLRRHDKPPVALVAWSDLEPFVDHVPTSRLRLAHLRLERLHPAQIADLVEAATHAQGEEILRAVGHDKELEADVFEELDDEHQLEFLRERSDQEVAAVLARMASDDAADLLLEIDQDRRLPVLEQMPFLKRRKIRTLLGFNPSTAGGLMNPDFPTVTEDRTVAQTLETLRRVDCPPEQLRAVYLIGSNGALLGAVPLGALIKSEPAQTVGALIEGPAPAVSANADLPEIARTMADYNLGELPVLDEEERMIGVVSVDDLLEQMLPTDWRRRTDVARG
jgi:CBS domain-containing protein